MTGTQFVERDVARRDVLINCMLHRLGLRRRQHGLTVNVGHEAWLNQTWVAASEMNQKIAEARPRCAPSSCR